MAREAATSSSWVAEAAPIIVVVLLAAHILALVYWLYRLASEKQTPRRKTH